VAYAQGQTAASESLFSESYHEARDRFCGAAHAGGFELRSYPIAARGPEGEALTIDVALHPHASARRTLVISSGTHGVEGYFGSAVQLALLEDAALLAQAKESVRVVLIHAVNPFGFAHGRRVNELNIDQNRNFILDGGHFAGAPEGYRQLSALLNPSSAPTRDAFYLRALAAVLRSGFRQLKNAVAQGQYEYPQGLFYGGREPSQSQHILRAELAAWIGQSERVLHLDMHTGVGKRGSYALCIDLPEAHARVAELKREFGAAAVQGFSPNGVLYEISGALGPWLAQCAPGVQYDCLLAEFGTYPGLSVLSALRYDNRVHHYAADDVRLREQARARMSEAFCPRAPAWRRLVIARALAVISQALKALA
jgi:predicted deacylase